MILEVGSKVLVVHRRLFENDRARYFVGTVDCCEAGVAQVTGYTWVQDELNGQFVRKEDVRTKIIALASPGLIVYTLPPKVQLGTLDFEFTERGRLWLHDGDDNFRMDLSEICHAH